MRIIITEIAHSEWMVKYEICESCAATTDVETYSGVSSVFVDIWLEYFEKWTDEPRAEYIIQ